MGKLTEKRRLPADLARLVRQTLLIRLETREPDRHLGDDTRQDSPQALVQAQRRLPLDDLDTRLQEPAASLTRRAGPFRELHADFYGVWRGC